ncbi:MAG TPA: HNH endonuclease signature motif containing protein, partial [Streptosporangiaceae bacterium]|nr:HNH endonuclease signature motif containing protein [Streptosporangiaceae bacterium]
GAAADASAAAGAGAAAEAAADAAASGPVPDRAANARLMDDLIRQIIGKAADLMSGEPGLASMLRRGLAGPGLAGPSLPLDVGDTDDIPWHIRKAVDIRGPQCEFPSGCDRPALECQPHHIIHRAQHGATSVTGLKNYCHFHHHVLIHREGWTVTPFPDGTSEARSPDGQTIIRSHQRPPPQPPEPPPQPPPRPG